MESPAHSDLAQTLSRYHFDDLVASILKSLFSYDQVSLRFLRSIHPKLKIQDIKKSLLLLVKYQLVDYVKTTKNLTEQYEYFVAPHRVFCFFRMAKYIEYVRRRHGDVPALVLECLAEKGILNSDKLRGILLKRAVRLIDPAKVTAVEDSIKSLIDTKLLAQVNNDVSLNIEELNRRYRDELLIDTIHEFHNKEPQVRNIAQAILRISYDNTSEEGSITSPVPLKALINHLCPSTFKENHQLERCLTKLTADTNFRFFEFCGDREGLGPTYALNVGLIFDYLLREHICSMITSKFGPKCCRVFKMLLFRGPLLLKQIEESIMLPARDVREYCYMLIKAGLVRNRQVPKTPDNAPGKSIFIMSVEIDQVVYKLADLSCRSITNLILRLEFEKDRNRTLLTRAKAARELIDGSCVTMSGDTQILGSGDWDQYFNTHELAQLNSINRSIDKILLAKSQVDDTLLLAHIWQRLRPSMETTTE